MRESLFKANTVKRRLQSEDSEDGLAREADLNMHFLILLMGSGGVGLRYGIDQYFLRQNYWPFLSTLVINVVGSFLAASIFQLAIQKQFFSEDLKTALIVGFCGGFTTFSGFGLQCLQLWSSGKIPWAVAYAVFTPVLSLAATLAGVYLVGLYK